MTSQSYLVEGAGSAKSTSNSRRGKGKHASRCQGSWPCAECTQRAVQGLCDRRLCPRWAQLRVHSLPMLSVV